MQKQDKLIQVKCDTSLTKHNYFVHETTDQKKRTAETKSELYCECAYSG